MGGRIDEAQGQCSERIDEVISRMAAHPEFLSAMQGYFQNKYALNSGFPVVMRLISNIDKSLVSGIVFSVWLEGAQAGRRQDCTVASIVERTTRYGLLSPNTVKGMIEEFANYGMLERKAEPGNKKNKVVEVAPFVPHGVRFLHESVLTVLDRLLEGERLEVHRAQPDAYLRAHPFVVDSLASDAGWRSPPPSVKLFHAVKYGPWIAEHLIMRVRSEARDGGFYVIDDFNRTETGAKYMLSRSSVQRLFQAAEKADLMKQSDRVLLISEDFVDQFNAYCAREIASFELGWKTHMASGTA
jgi:hypothetical protein